MIVQVEDQSGLDVESRLYVMTEEVMIWHTHPRNDEMPWVTLFGASIGDPWNMMSRIRIGRTTYGVNS